MDGKWWLGDFGSAVRMGAEIQSTTRLFAPFPDPSDPTSASFATTATGGMAALPCYDW